MTYRRAWITCGTTIVLGALAPIVAGQGPSDKEGLRVDREVVVEASLEEVWRTWTTAEGVKAMGPPDARIELALDGAYEWYFMPDAPPGERGSEGCAVLSFVPREMLAFSWNAPPSFPSLRNSPRRTQVVVCLESVGPGKVRVRLTQPGFGEGDEWARLHAYFDRAWGSVLEALREHHRRIRAAGEASPSATPTVAASKSHWAYFVRPAREEFFTGPTADESRIVSEHAAYIRKLCAEGVVLVAGPCFEPTWYPQGPRSLNLELPTPGIVVFEADSQARAQEIMEQDPAVREGVFKARLNTFKLAFERQKKTEN